MERLEIAEDFAAGYREADLLADLLVTPAPNPPAGETLAFLMDACQRVQAAARVTPPIEIAGASSEAVAAFSRLVERTALLEVICRTANCGS